MRKTLYFILICVLVGATPGYGVTQMGNGTMSGAQIRESPAFSGDTPEAKIFRANCTSCHPNGENIIVPVLPLKNSRVLENFKTFLNFLRHPKMPDGSEGPMPAFTKSEISDQEAKSLYHFIMTATENSGIISGYGIKPGMMGGGGYSEDSGMIGPGYYGFSPECQKFYDETAKLRKELHDKSFEYFETLRNPKATGEMAMKLDKEIMDLQDKINAIAPLECPW